MNNLWKKRKKNVPLLHLLFERNAISSFSRAECQTKKSHIDFIFLYLTCRKVFRMICYKERDINKSNISVDMCTEILP